MGKKIVIILAAILGTAGVLGMMNPPAEEQQPIVSVSPSAAQVQSETFTYEGREGVDALTILKEKTAVEQSSSGLVSSINGRKAEESKQEFWAFYVNGKMAEVGPAEYMTKDGDKVEWKIETY